MTAAAYPGEPQTTVARNRGTMCGLVGANQKIPAGAWVALVGGYWVNVTATTGLEGRIGRCLKDVDNTGGADGAASIDVQLPGGRELVLIANDTVAPVTLTDLGGDVYWLDNATISVDDDGGARSRAGRAWAFYKAAFSTADQTRVWVEVQ